MANYRCMCGGIMRSEKRQNLQTQAVEDWYVCPFCQAQRPVKDVTDAKGQGSEEQDRVLTQVC